MKRRYKILIGVFCVVIILVIATGFGLRNQIRSMGSVKKVTDGFYQMTYYSDYKLDDMCQANISTIPGLLEWISDHIFFGYPIMGNGSGSGCSAFLAQSPDGDYLMGRNYDYNETETLILFTAPDDGYQSYAIAALNMLGVGGENGIGAEELFGKVSMLASPYTITEGLNEKGLGVAILELETEEIHQDNGKPDMLLFVAVRMLLDKAANVDEAVTMLNEYDIHTFFGYPFHLFISDVTGKSVVVEWIGNEMSVIDADYVTNFQLSEGEDYGYGLGQDRYAIIEKKFGETNGVLSAEESMKLLSDVMVRWKGVCTTEWSIVMNLTDFTMDVCIDMNYEDVYTLTKEDFIQ